MAGEWLKFDNSLPEKPETLAITIAMGWDDPDLTVGKLMRLFRWFDQHTVDGNARAVTPALLDRLIGAPGFAQALETVGWLRITDGGLSLNNFDKHNGQSAKSRSETAKRVANHRAKKTADEPDADYQRLCIPRPIRSAVLARDGNACVYCHRAEGEYGPMETKLDGQMHMDHVIPLTQGGSDDVDNLVTACRPCNMFKGDRTPDECGLTWPMRGEKRFGNRKTVTKTLPREEKRREEEIPSVAIATGDKPPMSPDEIIFSYGLSMLVNAGTPEKQARSFLGGLRRVHGDDALIDKLRECAKAKVLQPLEWLAAALPPASRKANPKAEAVSFAEQDRRAGWARWEEMSGQKHPELESLRNAGIVIDIPANTVQRIEHVTAH